MLIRDPISLQTRPTRRLHREILEQRYVLDSTVVFSEIMYNPGLDQNLEWIELYNEMSVDMDLSDWSVDGIDFRFPEGTVLKAQDFLIIAKSPDTFAATLDVDSVFGPYGGRLRNSGESLRLINNSDRVMDQMDYRDSKPWPVGPDGSGASLSKIHLDGGSRPAANWTTSDQIGGTPGTINFPNQSSDDVIDLIFNESNWSYDESGRDYGTTWRDVNFDTSDPNQDGDLSDAWKTGTGLFGRVADGSALSVDTELNTRPSTRYFLTDFNLNEVPDSVNMELEIIVDDGAVIYVNGNELWRHNMPDGPILFSTSALESVGQPESQTISITASAFSSGLNRVAVELHQAAESTDPGVEPPIGLMEIEPAGDFQILWDGTDGDFFNAAAPPLGALVPGNAALASRGAIPFAGSDLGPQLNIPFHVTDNLNDGFYGNSNSWIGADQNPFAPSQFAGIRFPEPIQMQGIAWGRDNGNDTSDACGGQCQDRSLGKYEIQFTNVSTPDQNTQDTGDATTGWQSIGSVDYLASEDTDPGGGFTSFLRHRYFISQTNGHPVIASGIRIIVPQTGLGGGTAIDEIEVYADTGLEDAVFGVSLSATRIPTEESPLIFNEVAGVGEPEFFVEIKNPGATSIDLNGFQLVSSDANVPGFSFDKIIIQPNGLLAVTAEQLGFVPTANDRLFFWTPDRENLLDAVRIESTPAARSIAHENAWLVPSELSPGMENIVAIEKDVVINEILYHAPATARSGVPATFESTKLLAIDDSTVWRYRVDANGLDDNWAIDSHVVGNDGWKEGPALIGFERSALSFPIRTELSNPAAIFPPVITYYFEREFEIDADPLNDDRQLALRHMVDDGAVFYINGVEVFRFNMPDESDRGTFATPAVSNALFSEPIPIPTESLKAGANRISVEVHQASVASNDIVFGVELLERGELTPAIPGQPYTESNEEWIEIWNHSDTRTVDLTGWKIDNAVRFDFPDNTTIEPGEYLLVARDAEEMSRKYPDRADSILGPFDGTLSNRNDQIELLDAVGNAADVVNYFDGGRWSEFADGGGSSLELVSPGADNNQPESWASSVESTRSEWQTVRYRGVVTPDGFTNGVTSKYNEFILGMLDSGEVLIDDVSVVEDPDGAAIQRIQNGSFENDSLNASPDKWRIRGNHLGTVVTDPTDAENQVLFLQTTGAMEDRLNHAETTFVGNASIRNGNTYEISLRAKWINGSNQLNTHLYFDRLSTTTRLTRPTSHGTPGAQNSNFQNNLGPTLTDLKHSPVIPSVDEVVTISVQAKDPDQISKVLLWYSVDNADYQSVPMTRQGNEYSAEVPGQDSDAVVQFYVQGEDRLGAQSVFPADGPDSSALFQVPRQNAREGIHNLRIIMTPENRTLLHERTNVTSNHRLGATVIYNESEVFYDVGVRLKGSNAGRGNSAYLGFNIGFDPMQLFRGVHASVAIDRSGRSSVASQAQDEIIIKHIANAGGDIAHMYDDLVHVIAPKRSHTRTALLMMARYNDVFLDSQFENGSDGTVFKLDIAYVPNGTTNGDPESLKVPFPYSHPQPTKDLQDLGDDKEAYRSHIIIRNNRDRDDYSAIIAASKALSLRGAALVEAAQEVIDIDQWARVFALQSLTGAADVYTRGGLHHNIDFFVRPNDQKVVAFPWDWDFAFTASPNQSLIGTAGTGGRLMNSPTVRRLYHGHMLDLMHSTFHNDYLDPWIDHYAEVARQNYRAIKRYVEQRRDFVLSRLPSEIEFEITTNNGERIETDARSLTLNGRGWIDVREIRLANSQEPLNVHWTSDSTWQMELPLVSGPNHFELTAFNHDGVQVGSDSILVTSSAENRVFDWLRISEINYNPYGPTDAELEIHLDLNNDDFEFIEITNIGDGPIELANLRFTDGFEFAFPPYQLNADQYAVIVKDNTAFELRYGSDVDVVGVFTAGNLSNRGERIAISDPFGNEITSVEFGDGGLWPSAADGFGPTLEFSNSHLDVNLTHKWYSWQASQNPGGSAGRELEDNIPVVINEVAIAENGRERFVELANTGDAPIDIGGMFLSDSFLNLFKFEIPEATVLRPGDYVVFNESTLNANASEPNKLTFDADKPTEVWLSQKNATGTVGRFIDQVLVEPMEFQSYGRVPDGVGRLVPTFATKAEANVIPGGFSTAITQIHYHPKNPSAASLAIDPELTAGDLEFVTLWQTQDFIEDLGGWKLSGGIEFEFPPNFFKHEVFVVSFDPNNPANSNRLQAFLTEFPEIGPRARIVGPFSGKLDNNGDYVRITRPKRGPANDANPHYVVEEVVYDNLNPWPDASGNGLSIHRNRLVSHFGFVVGFGGFGENWHADQPSTLPAIPLGDLNADGILDEKDINQMAAALRDENIPAPDLNNDGIMSFLDYEYLIEEIFQTTFGDSNLDRQFNSRDLVLVFQRGEYEDNVPFNSSWSDGDWNGDGEFSSSDMVFAFQKGDYVFESLQEQIAAAIDFFPTEENQKRMLI